MALSAACTEKPERYSVTMQARCRDCVVSHAGGVAHADQDTLIGVPDPSTGDTVAEERSWKVELEDGANVFMRACRLHPDTAYGDIALSVTGEVRSISATADTSADCVEINEPVRAR